MFVLQSPDGEWTNWLIARAMIADDRHLTGLLMNQQHNRAIAKQWDAIGKGDAIPFALCFGVPPAANLVSGMSISGGADEVDYVGAVLGEPVPVVKCELNDLTVPATSEIVLEV